MKKAIVAFELFLLAAMVWVPCFGDTSISVASTKDPKNLSLILKFGAVCFSPDEKCDEHLVKVLNIAVASIDVAVYDINRPNIVQALIEKAKTIPVRLIVDERQSRGSRSSVPYLVETKVQVRFGHQRGIMHDKFALIDGAILETGSFNYTTHASEANQENQFYSVDHDVFMQYQARFDKMWASSKPYVAKPAK